jgi:hypothetical protein
VAPHPTPAPNAPPPNAPPPNGVSLNGNMLRGRAAVVPRPAPVVDPTGVPVAPPPRVPRPDARTLKLGGGWTWFGAIFAFCCWSVWAVANRPQNLVVPVFGFGLVLLVGAGLFALERLVGRYVLERWLGRVRRTARLSHLGVALYLVAVGIAYLAGAPWVASLWNWLSQ